jgi:hypothetical protein
MLSTINRGVRALARETGMSESGIRKRLKKGATLEQIRRSVQTRGFMRSGRRGVGTRKARERAMIARAAAFGRVYIPSGGGNKAMLFDAQGRQIR